MKSSAIRGALILGVAGFIAGFLGPIALNPDANQGPLLGIFLTGPGGVVLGAIVGAILAVRGTPPGTITAILVTIAAPGAAVILFFCLPQPEFRGNVVEVETLSCSWPDALRNEAFADWDKRIAAASWAAIRPGWKEDFDRLVASDPGVVVTVRIKRSVGLYEHRKPWNRGTYSGGKSWWVRERYFRRGVRCSEATGSGIFTATSETSKTWPSDNLPGFLNLQVLKPASANQVRLLQ